MQGTLILDNWQQPCLRFWCRIALFQASFWHFFLVARKGANTPKTLAGFNRAAIFHWTGQSRIISADQTRVVLWSLRNCAPKGVIHTSTSSRTTSDQGTAVGSIRRFLSCFLVMNKQTASAQVASFLEAFPLAPFVARMRRYLVGGSGCLECSARFLLLLQADLALL
ncbi:unnamed protein product [Ixodes persulcatus]